MSEIKALQIDQEALLERKSSRKIGDFNNDKGLLKIKVLNSQNDKNHSKHEKHYLRLIHRFKPWH